MTEIMQLIAIVGVFYGSWKLDSLNRTVGRIEATLENQKEDHEDHDKRITRLESDRHPDHGPIGHVGGRESIAG